MAPKPKVHTRRDLAPSSVRTLIVPRLLKRVEAAAYLALSASLFDMLRQKGEVRAVPIPSDRNPDGTSRVPLFDRQDLDRLIEKWKATDAA